MCASSHESGGMLDFEWDDDDDPTGNVAHIAAHGVTPTEAEEALLNPDQVPARAHPRPGERRRAVIGRTAAGRMLYVVYVEHANIIYIVTAYQAHDREKRQYRRGR